MAKQSRRQGVAAHDRSDTLATRLLQRMPGGNFVREQIDRAEQLVLGELKQRLDRLESSPSVSVVSVSVHTPQSERGTASPSAMLRELLTVANEHNHEQSLEESCIAILRSLVPDEARILAALSDGSGYPLLHVMAGPRIGLASFPILEYVSSVGRNAGVLCPELTPAYVRHLAAWGLTETAPENDEQRTQYEILETDTGVRRAIARIEENGERARIVRRTLKMSDLGMMVWNRCQIEPDASETGTAFDQ